MLAEITTAVRGLIDTIRSADLPYHLDVNHPPQSPLAGHEAGRFMLRRDAAGGFVYEWKETPEVRALQLARRELVIAHAFGDLDSLALYLAEDEPRAVFVYPSFAQPATVRAIDEATPEAGTLKLAVQRHPTFWRWWKALGQSEEIDLSHGDLADLLLDNAEDLVEPQIARVLSQFSAARTVSYTSNLGADGGTIVSVKWDGKADSAGTPVSVPREIVVMIPPYIGAWVPGGDPALRAVLRLRVLPPEESDSAEPQFRVRWANLHDWEEAASHLLYDRVRERVGQIHAVYLGTPDATKYVLPARE